MSFPRGVIEAVDRYTGRERPDPRTVCKGHCEGMGFHPLQCTCGGSLEGHQKDGDLKGWCWKTCATCGGTGKRAEGSR